MAEVKRRLLTWGVASRPRAGEKTSGDRCVVVEQSNGALLAVADGLGHGAEAAVAADLALQTVEASASQPLIEIVKRCHQALLRTRGAALSLARWDARERVVTWIGIGNVEGFLLRRNGPGAPAGHRLVLRGGVVGVRLPALVESPVAVDGRGLLVLATDGIAAAFDDEVVDLSGEPETLARKILEKHARANDDALALVARLEV